jgi:hypothetical protein
MRLTIASGALAAAAAAVLLAAPDVRAATPRVACWNQTADTVVDRSRRPTECGLRPRNQPLNNYLMSFDWSRWGQRRAVGRGGSFRLWADVTVRLSRPRRVCGGRYFTKARIRYHGSSTTSFPTGYRLRNC